MKKQEVSENATTPNYHGHNYEIEVKVIGLMGVRIRAMWCYKNISKKIKEKVG